MVDKIDLQIEMPIYVIDWTDETWCFTVDDYSELAGSVEEWHLDPEDHDQVDLFDARGRKLSGKIDIASHIELDFAPETLSESELKIRLERIKAKVAHATFLEDSRPSWLARLFSKLSPKK